MKHCGFFSRDVDRSVLLKAMVFETDHHSINVLRPIQVLVCVLLHPRFRQHIFRALHVKYDG